MEMKKLYAYMIIGSSIMGYVVPIVYDKVVDYVRTIDFVDETEMKCQTMRTLEGLIEK